MIRVGCHISEVENVLQWWRKGIIFRNAPQFLVALRKVSSSLNGLFSHGIGVGAALPGIARNQLGMKRVTLKMQATLIGSQVIGECTGHNSGKECQQCHVTNSGLRSGLSQPVSVRHETIDTICRQESIRVGHRVQCTCVTARHGSVHDRF